MTPFAKFMTINGLKRKDVAAFLGVSGAFITQISSGMRNLPDEKLAAIKANAYGWDVSMLTESENPMTDQPKEQSLVDYLQRQVADKDALIRELYKQIGILEEKLDSARKGETASHVGTSSAVHVG
jgi:transcriptional regulator with XRE-family HTH domain